jgi:hypothetical protein
MFYLFGSLGFVWVLFWIVLYTEVRAGGDEEEFIQPPKVSVIWQQYCIVIEIVENLLLADENAAGHDHDWGK